MKKSHALTKTIALLTLMFSVAACSDVTFGGQQSAQSSILEENKGEQGPQGPTGSQGIPGEDGKDGTTILRGHGEPSSDLGKNGDSYINTSTWDFYVKENDKWVLKGNLIPNVDNCSHLYESKYQDYSID